MGRPKLLILDVQNYFSTMYYGLLRISKITGQHPILAQDVHVGVNKKKFLLILRMLKTHWKNTKPQMIMISATKKNSKSEHNRKEETSETTSMWK